MGGSNLQTVRRFIAETEGVDVGPFIRDVYVTGDTSAARPQAVAALAAYLDLLSPEVEIDASAASIPGFGKFHGREGMREFWRLWIEEWEHWSWTSSNWSEVGEHVIVDVQVRGVGRSSGAEVTWNHCQVLTFLDGKLLGWQIFNDRASALTAVESS